MMDYLNLRITKAFDGFSLDVELSMGNGLGVFLGFSGAGKSLTLDAIAGLMEPDKGYIRCGNEIFLDTAGGFSLPARERQIGYVFQRGALFPHMTVRRNIAYALQGGPAGERRERVEDIMDALHIRALAARYPEQISGGQAQRVAIARALVRGPRLLLLDEPFSALDRPIRLQMHKLLIDVRNRFNVPAVMVTHDIEEARAIADRIFIYSKGRIIQSGQAEQVIMNPHSPEAKSLLLPEAAAATFQPN